MFRGFYILFYIQVITFRRLQEFSFLFLLPETRHFNMHILTMRGIRINRHSPDFLLHLRIPLKPLQRKFLSLNFYKKITFFLTEEKRNNEFLYNNSILYVRMFLFLRRITHGGRNKTSTTSYNGKKQILSRFNKIYG